MLEEILVVFIFGLLFGQLLNRKGIKPKLYPYSTAAAAILVFTLGLNIGLAKDNLATMLPVAGVTSLVLGVTSALASIAVAYLLRGGKK